MQKVFLFAIFLFAICKGYSATRTIANGGGNYNSASTWVEGLVPTSADDVVATSTSGKLIINVTSAAKTLVLTNYVDTLVVDANLSVSGTITLASGMKYTGSSNLICLSSGTLTSNGIVVSGGLQLNGTNQTYTLADNWEVNGLLTCNGLYSTTLDGYSITCNGGYTQSSVAVVLGTTNFILAGGTWTSTTSSNTLRNNLSFAGNVSLASTVAYNSGTISYTSGTITTSGSTLSCVLSTTFNCKEIAWNNIVLGGASQTYTLSDTLDINGLLTCNGTVATTVNGAAVKLGGGYSQSVPSLSGSTKFIFDGKGTWNGVSSCPLKNDLFIALSDTLTIGTSIAYNTGTFTYLSGVVNTTGSTLTIGATTNLSYGIDSINWNNISLSMTYGYGDNFYTLGRNLHLAGTLELWPSSTNDTLTFVGAYNIYCDSVTIRHVNASAHSYYWLSGDIICSGTIKVIEHAGWNQLFYGNKNFYTAGLDMTGNSPVIGGNCSLFFTGGGSWYGAGVVAVSAVTFAGNTTLVGSLTCASNINYSSGVITTTGSTMNSYIVGTINSAGITWENFTFKNYNSTVTLTSDLDVNGVLRFNATGANGGGTATINGYTIHCWSLDWNAAPNSPYVVGTTNIVMDGTGTITGEATGSISGLSLTLTFNTAGTITGSGNICFKGDTINYVAGTIDMSNATLYSKVFTYLNTSDMTWGNLLLTYPLVLLSDINVSGSCSANITAAYNGAYTYKCGGNLTFNGTITGASKWLLNGKGTVTTSGSYQFKSDLNINSSDTITLGNFNLWGTFTYTAGAIVSTGSMFSVYGASTITINGPGFNLDNYASATQALGGTNGFTIKNFFCYNAGATITFAAGKIYTITNSLNLAGTSASRVLFNSSVSGTQATVTLNESATEDVAFCNATDIKSDLGQRIWSYKGVFTRSPGWLQLPTEPRTVSYTF